MPGSAANTSSLTSGLPQPPGSSILASTPAGLPQPPAAGVNLQQKDEEISELRKELAKKDSALIAAIMRSHQESTQLTELREDLIQQQEAHKAELEAKAQAHEAELAKLRETTVSKEVAMGAIKAWEESNKELEAKAEAHKAELKIAQVKLDAAPQVKAEDTESAQQLQSAQTELRELNDHVKALMGEITKAKCIAEEATEQASSSLQAEKAAQSELQASKTQCSELQQQLEQEKQDFAAKFDTLTKDVANQAAQYIQDLKQREREIGILRQERGDVQDDGRHEHKRSRDSSHGRDSKRRR